MLKVVHLHVTSDAGDMAYGLHKQLLQQGVTSSLHVQQARVSEKHVYPLQQEENEWAKRLRQQAIEKKMPDVYSPHLLNFLQSQAFAEADIVHLHATGTYFSYLLLPFLAGKPLVWTLYDCRNYTGTCFHSAHCELWQEKECQDCPIDARQGGISAHHDLYKLKKQIYQTLDMEIVCTSQWQQKQVARSMLSQQNTSYIPLGINTKVFHPGDKLWFRNELELPEESYICLYYCSDEMAEAGLVHLRQAMEAVAAQRESVLLVCVGKDISAQFQGSSIAIEIVNQPIEEQDLANYLRASDVLVQPQLLEQTPDIILKAAACGCPAVAFSVGAVQDWIQHKETGYLVETQTGTAFAEGILWLLQENHLEQTSKSASLNVRKTYRLPTVTDQYIELYKKLAIQVTAAIPDGPAGYLQVIQQAKQDAEQLLSDFSSWEHIWKILDRGLERFTEQEKYKGVYIDSFVKTCLRQVDIQKNKDEIWSFVHQWLLRRKPEPRCGHLVPEEKGLQGQFCQDLRQKITEYFLCTSIKQINELSRDAHETITRLWRWIFLNSLSCINLLEENTVVDEQLLLTEEGQSGYPKLYLQSMYNPHPTTDGNLVLVRLLQSKAPISMKFVVLLWLTNASLYNGTSEHREVVLKNIEIFCRYAADHLADTLPPGFVNICMEQFTSSLWRISYVGGNNLAALSAFGDFIYATMKKRYGSYELPRKHKRHRKSGKLRIGYLSTNFRNQAVSFYMANRILLHDAQKFEIYTYVLNRHADELTDKIRANSDKVFEYTDFNDLEPIIKDIRNSELDLLIYADIGMDPFTYELGSLRLVPVQAVLVGHGVTTGLKNIDYYISGDFEPEEAQGHYREKIIRLPNLGASQMPPQINQHGMKRETIGVPEDAVLLMSCANGIKHHPHRDRLLVEILKQAPEAWIVLKPFQNPNSIDGHLNHRIMEIAKQEGVEKRLIILPPLGNPADLWGLLTLADIQLDTYPYGGWTTNMEALYAGLPIVTQEGGMARSRWGAGMLRALGVDAGIAKNEAEYVDWAVRLVQDKKLRESVAQRIREKVQDTLFNGEKAQGDYEKVLLEIGRGK